MISDISETHIRCFPGTFITSLGKMLIASFYSEYLKEENPFWIAEREGKIIGFCMGYYNGSHAKDDFIRKNKIKLILRMFILCLRFNTLAISRVMSYLKYLVCKPRKAESHVEISQKQKEADLLSICVIDEYKGLGVSANLVSYFESELLSKKVSLYTLSVLKSNPRAIHFYKKIGMRKSKETNLGYVMIKIL